jgi:hypothetical protein
MPLHIGVAIGLALDPALGVVAGGLFGPLVAMAAYRTPEPMDGLPPKIIFGPPG